MRGRIVHPNRPVPSFAGVVVVDNQNGADWNFAFGLRLSRECKRFLHPGAVACGPAIAQKCLNLGIQALVSYGTLIKRGA
jgi:hypothetical protein